MGLSFDILIFDCLLKAPQPVTGLFLKIFSNFCIVLYCRGVKTIRLWFGNRRVDYSEALRTCVSSVEVNRTVLKCEIK